MQTEIGLRVKAGRPRAIVILAISLAAVLGSAGFYVFGRDAYSENQIRRLIEVGYNSQRPGGGRLSNAAYSQPQDVQSGQANLAKAQLLLLRYSDSDTKQRLQSLIYLAAGNWKKYVDAVALFPPTIGNEPAVLNNLGASFLGLSEEDPRNLLKALEQFERAVQLDPNSLEPRFNLVITYRKLRLHKLADDTAKQYASMDSASAWHSEILVGNSPDRSVLIDGLRRAVEEKNQPESERIFERDPDLFRNYAGQYASSDIDESPALLQFIASEMEQRYGDKTFSAMLAPLFSEKRKVTIAFRQFVTEGAESFVHEDLTGSFEAYRKAEGLVDKTDSAFDRLWLDLNRVDTQIRSGQFATARETLQRLVSTAHKNRYLWLEAKALSIYGSTLRLTSSYNGLVNFLADADHILAEMKATHDRIRVLYYRAFYQYGAGDNEEALKFALECIQRSDEADSLRIASVDWLIASVLYKEQLRDRAILFAKESIEQSQKSHNLGMETLVASTLAQLYESMSRFDLAEQYLKVAETGFEKMPSGFDQTRTELVLGILRSRIELDRKQYAKAQSVLERNIEIYSRQPFRAASPLLSPSLMLLAETYAETGQTKKAAQKFDEAINIVENDDQYMQSEKLRIKFDDERRDLYDSAIEFQYENDMPDAAWGYLQRYRSKLFIEFLAQFDPDVAEAHAEALDRSRVQALIPSDAQVLEYALLKNRLLIWVISKNQFMLRSLAISRSEVEGKVQEVLQKLRNQEDVDALLSDLGKILIGPVADLLDVNRTVVIIPDRALHGLPFEVLRRPGKSEYLIQQFPILISPNLTHLLLTKAVQPRRDSIVGFTSQNGGSSEVKELAALAEIYPKSETFSGQQVGKSNFLGAMRTAAVLHYAGHSATDAVDPLGSSILLDGNRFGPNSVTAVDIAQQRLENNAVVVLSSCDSSVGNSRDGVGMRGLTSAFLIGGAGSVVGSLWPVEASSTADLMIRFHRTFANGRVPVAKALREAQLGFLHAFPERSHPYYWSGFVVTGNFSALR
jgi:CHAT domain-containing protein